ncbi:hypothetical protein Ntsu_57540 [Nocardia sp. IFM 10818]
MIATASRPVVRETARAACAGVAPKAADRLGSRAWALYIEAKVVRPAAKSASVIRRSCGTAVTGASAAVEVIF